MELRPINGDHSITNPAKFRSYGPIGTEEKIKMLKDLDYRCLVMKKNTLRLSGELKSPMYLCISININIYYDILLSKFLLFNSMPNLTEHYPFFVLL